MFSMYLLFIYPLSIYPIFYVSFISFPTYMLFCFLHSYIHMFLLHMYLHSVYPFHAFHSSIYVVSCFHVYHLSSFLHTTLSFICIPTHHFHGFLLSYIPDNPPAVIGVERGGGEGGGCAGASMAALCPARRARCERSAPRGASGGRARRDR